MPCLTKLLSAFACCLSLIGCATQQPAKPLNVAETTQKLLSKDPNSTAFKQYLIKQGYSAEALPLEDWGLNELTYCALFFHTSLDVAKSQLALANANIKAAGLKNRPVLNAELAHSDQRNDDIKPWAYGLSVDIPIATAGKVDIRVDKARNIAEAARMDVAETAWQLRQQIAKDLTSYYQNMAEIRLLTQSQAVQTDIANMLEKRVAAGIASNTELSNIKLLALKSAKELQYKQASLALIKAKLASDVGLTPDQFASIQIRPLSIDQTLATQTEILKQSAESKYLQEQALLNRIDIRRSMAKYAAAEAEIRLEAANQVPDMTLSPGILFEFGDKIWSLGFSSLLNLLHQNTTLIERAKQLRAIEGAQFEDLQATIIAKTSQAYVRFQAAQAALEQSGQQYTQQLALQRNMQKQFDAGMIGKVALKQHVLNTLIAEQLVLTAKFDLLQIAHDIENIMQKPLYNDFTMPEIPNDG